MKSERWRQIDRVLEAALERNASQRAVFLEEACAGDDALRREVEALLQAHEQAGSFIESPAFQVSGKATAGDSTLSLVGRSLGAYQILSLLGLGGMGEVYLARDSRLERPVALKVLPREFASDPDRMRRFVREAKAASALNHPNIATIYEIGESGGVRYIAMECVEGETLAARANGQPREIQEVIQIGLQVADALAEAHSRGIIHRDIKPANVMMTQRGEVKVLDFGLAKVAGPDGEPATQTNTATGMVMGTVVYMSPEQALGQELDQRTDLYSLGATLHEMASGSPPFNASTPAALFDAIIHQSPAPLRQLNGEAPEELERIIGKALEKDRQLRYQTAADLRADLKRLQLVTDSKHPSAARSAEAAPSVLLRWKLLVWAGVVMVLLLALGVAWYTWRSERTRPDVQQRQLTTNVPEMPVTSAAISPDGKYLAFSDDAGTYLRLIDKPERHSLFPPATLKTSHLAWLPDGTGLVVSGMSGGDKTPSLWSVSILGGEPRKLRDQVAIASVAPDGSRIAFVNADENEIWLMGGNGENPRKIVTGSTDDRFVSLMWFPHGRHLGYVKRQVGAVSIESYDLKDSSITKLLSASWFSDACFLSDGRLVYSMVELKPKTEGSLWEIPTDIESGQIRGEPRRIVNWAGLSIQGLSASRDGKRVAFLRGIRQADVYVGELEENGTRMKMPQRLTFDDRYDFCSAWTPDSRAVIFNSDRNGNFDIFKQALDQTSAEVIIATPEAEMDPTVSPDGTWILYFALTTFLRRTSEHPVSLMRAPIAGGPPELVLSERGLVSVQCAHSPSSLCVVDQQTQEQLILSAFDPLRGKGKELVRIDIEPTVVRYHWTLSPDGSQIAFSTESREESRIHPLSLVGGPSREILVKGWIAGAREWSMPVGTGWFSTGRSAGSEALLHIDPQGQASVLWQQPISPAGLWAIPSPDGRHLAFPASTFSSNAWMIENF
jgi:serine/threonine protein kinase